VRCFDPLIVAAGKIICKQYIFGVVVVNVEQALILALCGFPGLYLLSYLNIDFLVLAACYEIYLTVGGLSDIDGIAPAAEFKVYNIFKACCHSVGIITEHAVSQRSIGKVELFLRFQDFSSLEVIS
jgi:hypothetical protein